MVLDVKTVLIVVVFITALVGIVLALASLQNRPGRALVMWSAAYLSAAAGILLLTTRSILPAFVSIGLANALVAIAYGMAWQAAGAFDGRRINWPGLFAGAAIWVAACLVPPFYASAHLRVVLGSVIIACYSFATAWEIYCGHGELASRIPATALLVVHALIYLVRAALPESIPLPDAGVLKGADWNALLAFETIVFAIGMGFVAIALTKEQLEFEHRRDALVDPLTGTANRRGFDLRAPRLVSRHAASGTPLAIVAFDLDHFKTINDDFGHAEGDRILELFSDIAARQLRASDMLFRMGGEEFLCLLPEANAENAAGVAERIRAGFAEAAAPLCGGRGATVSAGIASSEVHGYELEALRAAADAALYRSKHDGRNRITPGLASAPGPMAHGDGNIVPFPERAGPGARRL